MTAPQEWAAAAVRLNFAARGMSKATTAATMLMMLVRTGVVSVSLVREIIPIRSYPVVSRSDPGELARCHSGH